VGSFIQAGLTLGGARQPRGRTSPRRLLRQSRGKIGQGLLGRRNVRLCRARRVCKRYRFCEGAHLVDFERLRAARGCEGAHLLYTKLSRAPSLKTLEREGLHRRGSLNAFDERLRGDHDRRRSRRGSRRRSKSAFVKSPIDIDLFAKAFVKNVA
jgi:hypothetical protein